MKTSLKLLPYLIMVNCVSVNAEVITDGSMGAAQNLTGSQFQIPQNLGTTVGNNLFHSFSQFNLYQGESATFAGDNSLKNVISRVTGGNVSTINGLLRSTIGHANFYFINPAGVTFGAEAQVDVPAAFHVSTADNLRFADGGQFNSTLSSASSLSVAEPVGFGFIANQGTVQIQQAALAFKSASSVSLSGNAVVIDKGSLKNPAGSLQIYTAGTANVDVDLIQRTASNLAGQTTITDSLLDVSGDGAGLLTLRSDTIDLNNATLRADNQGTTHADASKGVDVTANGLTLANGALISSAANSLGSGANIAINAGTLLLDGQGTKTGIETTANEAAGNAGDIAIKTNKLDLYYGGVIRSDTYGMGNAGKITVNSGQAQMNGLGSILDTGILTTTDKTATGNAGTITVNSSELSLINAVSISSYSNSAGSAGDVNINAAQLLIDGQGNGAEISSNAADINSTATAKAGNITVTSKDITLFNGGIIRSNISTQNNAGNVTVNADNLLVDAQSGVVTGIFTNNTNNSWAEDNAGNSGAIAVTVGKLSLLNGGEISGQTLSRGDAGNISIKATEILIDPLNTNVGRTTAFTDGTGIFSDAREFSTGKASTIQIQTDKLTLLNGGRISSDTNSAGNAGNVLVEAKTLSLNGSGINTKISSDALAQSTGHAGMVTVNASQLNLLNAGTISSSTRGLNNAGNVSVNTDTLVVNGQDSPLYTGIFSDAYKKSAGNAGEVRIKTNDLSVFNSGAISTSIWSKGNAGNVSIAANNILLDGQSTGQATGISSNAQLDSSGNAGTITLTANNLTIRNGGQVRSDSMGQGNAGNVTIAAKQVAINRHSKAFDTGIFTDTTLLSGTGQAGIIHLTADALTLKSGAEISSNTDNQGNAGSILIDAKQLVLDGRGNRAITGIFSDASNLATGGNAGLIQVNSDNLTVINGAIISSNSYSQGNAGTVAVNSGYLTLQNTGKISSSTFAQGQAGDVSINAANIAISGQNTGIFAAADATSSGQTGDLQVNASNAIKLTNEGTLSIQNAGNTPNPQAVAEGVLTLISPVIDLDKGIITAATSGNVDAGTVTVAATQSLVAQNNSSITSSTSAAGAAGNVTVIASAMTLNNSVISSAATAQSGGQTSDIKVFANHAIALLNQGKISMQNDTALANPTLIKPTTLTVAAPNIDLKNSLITTKSTGNVNAGDIGVKFSGWLTMDPSFITTAAYTGNGGAINIQGGQGILLQDSGFMTSASGANSNGGNINVTADVLVLKTGVIQANAVGGAGGDINLTLKSLISSQNQLIKGGKQVNWQPFKTGLNVIQAASENGVSGEVNSTAPQFDISGSISGLNASALALPRIEADTCRGSIEKVSSLARSGKGGMPTNEKDLGFVPPILATSGVKTASAKVTANVTMASVAQTMSPSCGVAAIHP
jgi:filamentous hemagglutinin family protein